MKLLAQAYSTYIRYIFVSLSADFHEKEISYEKIYLFENLI